MLEYQLQMKKPIKEGDEIQIYTRVDYVKKTSYSLSQCVVDDKGEVCSTVKIIFVGIDLKTYKKATISKELITRMEEIEGKKLSQS